MRIKVVPGRICFQDTSVLTTVEAVIVKMIDQATGAAMTVASDLRTLFGTRALLQMMAEFVAMVRETSDRRGRREFEKAHETLYAELERDRCGLKRYSRVVRRLMHRDHMAHRRLVNGSEGNIPQTTAVGTIGVGLLPGRGQGTKGSEVSRLVARKIEGNQRVG